LPLSKTHSTNITRQGPSTKVRNFAGGSAGGGSGTEAVVLTDVAGELTGPWRQIDPLQPENQAVVVHLGSKQRITVKDPVPVTSSARRFMRLRAEPRQN